MEHDLQRDPDVPAADKSSEFFTSRSPSYARAREELENPSPAPDPELVAALTALAHTEEDAARQYASLDAALSSAPSDVAERANLHSGRAERLRQGVSDLGAYAGPASDLRSSQLPAPFSEMTDRGRDELERAMTRAEERIAELYRELDDHEMPAWLEDEIASIRSPSR